MSKLSSWLAAVAAVCVAGCGDGRELLSSPTGPSGPVAVATPTVPSSCAVPNAPDDLSVKVTGTAVNLSWSPVNDASDYVVLVGTTPSGSDILLTNTTEASYTLEGVEPGTHFARVLTHNWCGTSESLDAVAFTVAKE